MEMGLVNVCRGDLALLWWPVYRWYFLCLAKSDAKLLATPPYREKNFAVYLLKIKKSWLFFVNTICEYDLEISNFRILNR